jgi:hypothetical protein
LVWHDFKNVFCFKIHNKMLVVSAWLTISRWHLFLFGGHYGLQSCTFLGILYFSLKRDVLVHFGEKLRFILEFKVEMHYLS